MIYLIFDICKLHSIVPTDVGQPFWGLELGQRTGLETQKVTGTICNGASGCVSSLCKLHDACCWYACISCINPEPFLVVRIIGECHD